MHRTHNVLNVKADLFEAQITSKFEHVRRTTLSATSQFQSIDHYSRGSFLHVKNIPNNTSLFYNA